MEQPKLFLKFTKPVIEMPIVIKDPSGMRETFFVGLKRHNIEEAQKVVQALLDAGTKGDEELARKLVAGEILYLKELIFYDEADKEVMRISDTREAKNNAELWGDASNCLAFLLDLLFDWPSYSSAFPLTIIKANSNLQLGAEAERKNF